MPRTQLSTLWNKTIQIKMSDGSVKRRLNRMLGDKGATATAKKRKCDEKNSLLNREYRMVWCAMVKEYTMEEHWNKVVFSSRTSFKMDGPRVWHDDNTAQISSFGVIVWGCVTMHGVGRLVLIKQDFTPEVYIQILDENLEDSVSDTFHHEAVAFLFQQDNTLIHNEKVVERWLNHSDIETIKWPAMSPDLNIMQNLWREVATTVQNKQPTSQDEFVKSIQTAWKNIKIETISSLYQSIPQRIQLVIDERGFSK